MNKYLIFDLSVPACLLALALRYFCDRPVASPPASPEASLEAWSACDNVCDRVSIFTACDDTSAFLDRKDDDVFRSGDVVEVHDINIHSSYAFFGRIVSTNVSQKYEVRTLLGDPETFYDVPPSSLKPWGGHLDFGTRVICTYAESVRFSGSMVYSNFRLAPCVILSHDDRLPPPPKEPMQRYYVLEVVRGKVYRSVKPMSRIRPIVEMTRALREQFENLIPLDMTNNGDKELDSSGNNDNLISNGHLLGSIVEFPRHDNAFASPFVITKDNHDGTYDLRHTYYGHHIPGIDPEAMRPYHVYREGTNALCQRGNFQRAVPCTVVGRCVTDRGVPSYNVKYWDREKAILGHGRFPLAKVHRRIREDDGKSDWDKL